MKIQNITNSGFFVEKYWQLYKYNDGLVIELLLFLHVVH